MDVVHLTYFTRCKANLVCLLRFMEILTVQRFSLLLEASQALAMATDCHLWWYFWPQDCTTLDDLCSNWSCWDLTAGIGSPHYRLSYSGMPALKWFWSRHLSGSRLVWHLLKSPKPLLAWREHHSWIFLSRLTVQVQGIGLKESEICPVKLVLKWESPLL